MNDEAGFRTFVEDHGAALQHAARLLTGDHHRGEDLVQTVLTRVFLKWGRIDAPLAYARRALVTAHIDQSRRRWWGERPTAQLPETPDDDGGGVGTSDLRDQLRRLLAELGAQERAVVVLRFYCDLSERDTADTLGIPLGTVKSSCARALARMRVDATSPAGGNS